MHVDIRIETASRTDHHFMLGMRLDYMDVETFVEEFARSARLGLSTYCCVPDVHQCMICHDRADHRDIVNAADFVMSDSKVLQTARAVRYGVPAIRPIRGYEMMLALCRKAEALKIPIALIGGRDDRVLQQIISALAKDFPALRIVYGYSPPFRELTPAEETDMLRELAESGAQLVFVGIGCPKQEQWMGRYKGRIRAGMIGVGAAFDMIGGLVRPSPAFVHRFGLEWLYRLLSEPRRLFGRYLGSAPRFVWLVLVDWVRSGGGRNQPSTTLRQ